MSTPDAPPEYRTSIAEWLTALSLTIGDIPASSDLYITGTGDARTLHYEVCIRGTDGRFLLDLDGEPIAEQRTTPVTVEPPQHWQPRQRPTREQLLAAVERARVIADELTQTGCPWTGDEPGAGRRILAALRTTPPSQNGATRR
ncbi:hypothetical protein ACWGRF_02005 [Streptomyces zhihengii]